MATRTPPWTRRGFLQAGAAALSLAALPRSVIAENKADDEFGGFTLGVQSFTFRSFNIEGTLKRIKEVGLKHVEFSGSKHLPATATAEQLQAVLRLCKEYGVTPVCCGVYRFTKDHEANRKVFELGKTLGVRASRQSGSGQLRESRQAVRRVPDRRRHSPPRTNRQGQEHPGSLVLGRGHPRRGEEAPQADRRLSRHGPSHSLAPSSARSSILHSRFASWATAISVCI